MNDRSRPDKAASDDGTNRQVTTVEIDHLMLDAALELAASGWEVFPLNGKAAITPHGFKDATTDPDQIRQWWRRRPEPNIAIAVPKGMVVLDIDPRDWGDQTLARLELEHGQLPITLSVRTGSGGEHRWFKAPTTGLLQTNLGDGLQTRVGGKGYVVAPPSIHPQTRKPYQWVQPLAPVAYLPHWIIARLRPEPPRISHRVYPLTIISGGGQGFLDWAYRRIAEAPEGKGHDIIRNTAILAGGYIASGLVSPSEARRVLNAAAESWRNRYRNAERTIDDGLHYGREVKGPVR